MLVEPETTSMNFLHIVTLKFSHLIHIDYLENIELCTYYRCWNILYNITKSHWLVSPSISVERCLSFGMLSRMKFFKILIFAPKHEYYHWQQCQLFTLKAIGSLHFWENICPISKYLITVFPSVVLCSKNGVPWKVAS